VQLIKNEKTAVRQWTQKPAASSDFQWVSKRVIQNKSRRSRYRGIIELMTVDHSALPVERQMPVAKAELNFHEYALIADFSCSDFVWPAYFFMLTMVSVLEMLRL